MLDVARPDKISGADINAICQEVKVSKTLIIFCLQRLLVQSLICCFQVLSTWDKSQPFPRLHPYFKFQKKMYALWGMFILLLCSIETALPLTQLTHAYYYYYYY